MADECVTASNRTNESPTKTIESVLLINQSSLRESPNVDDDAKSDEIEREKVGSPSLEIAEECIESFIHQGLDNADNENGQTASTLPDTCNTQDLEISTSLSIGHNNEKSIDCNPLQENVSDTAVIHDSKRHNLKEKTPNIIMEAKNIINTCLLDAMNLDDQLSINADDDTIENSEKELNEVEKEMDPEEYSEKNVERRLTMNKEHDDRISLKPKTTGSEESNIDSTGKNCTKLDVASGDSGVNHRDTENLDETTDGKKDKKKHKHHKKHSKKKKKKHKKEKKAEKQKGKDSKLKEVEESSGEEDSPEDQAFEKTTKYPSIIIKPRDSLESKPQQKRKLASIVTCVSSANTSSLFGKGELGYKGELMSQRHRERETINDNANKRSFDWSSKWTESNRGEEKSNVSYLVCSKPEQSYIDDSTSHRHRETSKIDKSKRRSSERSSKSSESIKDEVKASVSSLSGKVELRDTDDSTSHRHKETSKIDKSKRRSSEWSSKSTESIKDEVKASVSSLSDKPELRDTDDSTSHRHRETSKIDKSKRRSSERSSKSSESIKDEVKASVSSLSDKPELRDTDDSTSHRHRETSKIDKSKRRSSERSSKSSESIKDEVKASVSSLSGKPELSYIDDSTHRHRETSKIDKSKRRSSERSSKSTESIKDEVKASVSSLSGKPELSYIDDSTHRHRETSKIDKSKRRSSERSSKSTESIKDELNEERLHRQFSNTSKSSETKDQVKDDNTYHHGDRPFGEKHKKRKKKHKDKREGHPQSLDKFATSSTKSEKCKVKQKRKRSESSETEIKKLPRQHSHESSRKYSQTEHQEARYSRSRSREPEEHQASGDQYFESQKQQKSKEKHGKRSRSKSKHSRSRSSSVDSISKGRSISRSISMDGQTKDELPKDQESRSLTKHKKRKKDSGRPRKRSQDEETRNNKDTSRSELHKESKRESSSTDYDPCFSKSLSPQKHPERTPFSETYQCDQTSEASDRDQTSPSRKRASKEKSPIEIEPKSLPRKRASSRSTSRERSPKKHQASREVHSDSNTNLNVDSTTSILTSAILPLATIVNEKQEVLARETDQMVDDAVSIKEEKEESKDDELVNKELKAEESGKVKVEASEDVREQVEANETLESAQLLSHSRNTQKEEGISNDTSKEVETVGDELESSATKEELKLSASSDTKSFIEKVVVEPGDEQNAKSTDAESETVESDQAMDKVSGRDDTSDIKNEPLNQNSSENTNIQFGIPPPPPPPPPHILVTQNQIVNSNPPSGPPYNLVCPPVINPYARTYPDPTMMDYAPIHQQPHNVPQCPIPQNISGPQIQSANQNVFNESNMSIAGNLVPQGFTLGPNQEHLTHIMSASSSLIQHSLLGLPASASVIPFLGEEGPKISAKKEDHLNEGAKTDVADSNHAHALVSSPVDMDMSSPEEEDIIEKMNEEFWENERKGNKKDDDSVPDEMSCEPQYDFSAQMLDREEEDYDPEHFLSTISPKKKKKKDKTKKHSDSKPKTKVQSLLDKLHRQARVEGEVKIVLKDYYKHREITKNEYKDILRKAVPQVANSDHSIDPERIRSLVKKYVAKVKGQRVLKPNS